MPWVVMILERVNVQGQRASVWSRSKRRPLRLFALRLGTWLMKRMQLINTCAGKYLWWSSNYVRLHCGHALSWASTCETSIFGSLVYTELLETFGTIHKLRPVSIKVGYSCCRGRLLVGQESGIWSLVMFAHLRFIYRLPSRWPWRAWGALNLMKFVLWALFKCRCIGWIAFCV